MDSYILSIIIPLYNAENYIEATIKRIKECNDLKRLSYEIILINDGSSDATDKLMKSLCDDKNIIGFSKGNGGIASARSLGLKKARGKYITFVDQDDLLIEGYDTYIRKCEDYNVDVLVTNPYLRFPEKEPYQETAGFIEGVHEKEKIQYIACNVLTKSAIVLDEDKTKEVIPNTIWNCIFKKELINENNIDFYAFLKYEDDWIFLLDCLAASKQIYLMHSSYYAWTINPNSESHSDKYLPDFYEKKSKAIEYKCNYLKRIGIDNNKIKEFYLCELRKRMMVFGMLNACMNPEHSFKKAYLETKHIFRSVRAKGKVKNLYKYGKAEKLFVPLITLKLDFIAVFLNFYIIKKKYGL